MDSREVANKEQSAKSREVTTSVRAGRSRSTVTSRAASKRGGVDSREVQVKSREVVRR